MTYAQEMQAFLPDEWECDYDGAVLTAPDGCRIEPDGECPHGHVSPLIEGGLI